MSDSLDDPARLAAVRRLLHEDEPLRGAFDHVADVVSAALDVPIALLSVVDDQRQSFIACVGLTGEVAAGTPLSHSFCQHVVTAAAPLIVEDARTDPRVQDNLAVRDLEVIAYAGMPVLSGEHVVASLCAIDHVPRVWTRHQLDVLERLAAHVTYLITARTHTTAERDAQRRLLQQREAVATLSGRLQRALLQQAPDAGPFDVEVVYQPGSRELLIGGDFAATRLDHDGCLDFVIGDVSGHGPEAAALGVGMRASWQALRAAGCGPQEVMISLEEIVHQADLMATVLLGTLRTDGTLLLTTAGHPAPLLLAADGPAELPLPPAPLLGLGRRRVVTRRTHTFATGGAPVLAYTDGLVEGRVGSDGERWGLDRLLRAITASGPAPEGLIAAAGAANGGPLPDDVAILVVGVG